MSLLAGRQLGATRGRRRQLVSVSDTRDSRRDYKYDGLRRSRNREQDEAARQRLSESGAKRKRRTECRQSRSDRSGVDGMLVIRFFASRSIESIHQACLATGTGPRFRNPFFVSLTSCLISRQNSTRLRVSLPLSTQTMRSRLNDFMLLDIKHVAQQSQHDGSI